MRMIDDSCPLKIEMSRPLVEILSIFRRPSRARLVYKLFSILYAAVEFPALPSIAYTAAAHAAAAATPQNYAHQPRRIQPQLSIITTAVLPLLLLSRKNAATTLSRPYVLPTEIAAHYAFFPSAHICRVFSKWLFPDFMLSAIFHMIFCFPCLSTIR